MELRARIRQGAPSWLVLAGHAIAGALRERGTVVDVQVVSFEGLPAAIEVPPGQERALEIRLLSSPADPRAEAAMQSWMVALEAIDAFREGTASLAFVTRRTSRSAGEGHSVRNRTAASPTLPTAATAGDLRAALNRLMDQALVCYGPGCSAHLMVGSRYADDERRWLCSVVNPEGDRVAFAKRRSPESATLACSEALIRLGASDGPADEE